MGGRREEEHTEEFETGRHDSVEGRLRLELFVVKDRLRKVVHENELGVGNAVVGRVVASTN